MHSASTPFKSTVPVKKQPSSPSTTTATLRTLYNRAAHAFLHRDIPLTHSLIESAFAVIHPPTVLPDDLIDHRRKWDILRITLESTVYSSPPSRPEDLPDSLRRNLIESPPSLITALYARSLALFTPLSGVVQKPTAAYLPSQVLITLVYASLRIDGLDAGRAIIEDWLSGRDSSLPAVDPSVAPEDTKKSGYEKVLELYCLQILPKLEQWDYAREFLEYEGELSHVSRENFKESLQSSRVEAMPSRQLVHTLSVPSPSSPALRSHSPATSSSSSSSISTTSTHTVVPSKPRGLSHPLSTVTPVTPTSPSTTSLSSVSTVTALQPARRPTPKSDPFSTSSSNRMTSPSRPHTEAVTMRPTSAGFYTLIKASLAPYLTTSNVTTLFLLFVVFPFVSFIIRARHRRRKALMNGGSGVTNNVEVIRRRLQGAQAGFLGRAWGEVVRAVSDTVKMAGSGLV